MAALDTWLDGLMVDATPDFDECLRYLAITFPLLQQFSNTEQDSEWHTEGNVATHTTMVLKELYQLLSGKASHITGLDRQALILSALLHDIAKPITTKRKVIKGRERVVAPKHEEQGASYLALKPSLYP